MNIPEHADSWFFGLLTFGCKVNQYESEALREAWFAMGGCETDDPALADVLVFNTCAITASAVADVRQALRRVRRSNAGARLVLTGCAAELPPEELAFLGEPALAPLSVIRQADKATLLCEHPLCLPLFGAETSPRVDDDTTPREVRASARSVFPPFRIEGFRRARPVLKVQDGCSHGCAYCIVPLTRGLPRSRALGDCVAEARRLFAAGHREIMLSGINLRQFKTDGKDFWDLLTLLDEELAPEWAGTARFRISSVDPAQLGEKGLDALAASRLVCPHLHLSLQSGSGAVLAAMRRPHYSPEQVVEAVKRLAAFWPRFGLGADLLMGFPGESVAHVEETLACVNTLPLTYAHVFPFSERPGTVAATLPHAVPRPERQERAARLRAAIESKQQAFLLLHLNETRLFMAPDGDGSQRGVDEYYVSCVLQDPLAAHLHGSHDLLPVRPVGLKGHTLLVKPVY